MAKWAKKGFDENDLGMGAMLPTKAGTDLIQNCDLPPPTKVFSGLSDNITVISSMNNRKKAHNFVLDQEDDTNYAGGKLGLLKALRLSQTRAREAEAKYAEICKERDALAVAVVQDSMQIFAYRQFVRLLECQVLQTQKRQVCCDCEKRQEDEVEDENGNHGLTFLLTVAFCLGIAGVGLAIGCKYFTLC